MAKIRQFKLSSNGQYELQRICEERKYSYNKPQLIPYSRLHTYLPFDHYNSQKLKVSNMLGMKIPDFILSSGDIYDGFDGKRLIYEVGCNSVIYTLVSSNSPSKYQFYLQSIEDFVYDVTTRSIAAKVSKTAAPIVTLIKYEMYFLLGLISTASIPALILVVGSDITVSSIMTSKKFKSGNKLSKVLLDEHQKIKTYAPTLHSKMEEFLASEVKIHNKNFGKNLPEIIIKDEKTQGQLAGVLVGKATISPKPFTFWSALFSIFTMALVKSVTKTPEAYGRSMEDRYKPILNLFDETTLVDQQALSSAASALISIFQDAEIRVTKDEAVLLLNEIKNNPAQIRDSILHINNAIKSFNREMN